MKMDGNVKAAVNRLYERVKTYKKHINGLLILTIILFGVTSGVEYITQQQKIEQEVLQAENELLKAKNVEERLRTQIIYFVMLRQADSLNVYKTQLINCQQAYLNSKKLK